MDLFDNVVGNSIGAVVGALIAFGLPYVARLRRNQSRLDLAGIWRSAYLIEDSGRWIEEEVEIRLKASRFHLRNVTNPRGDLYEATATLRNSELTGMWHTKSGHAAGSLLLAVRPRGGLLYGYYTGARENNERVFAAWVLGKGDDDIKQGKQLLLTQTLELANG